MKPKTLILYSDARLRPFILTDKLVRITAGGRQAKTDDFTVMHCYGRDQDYDRFHGHKYTDIVLVGFPGDFDKQFIDKLRAICVKPENYFQISSDEVSFTDNDLATLYRLVDNYCQEAEKEDCLGSGLSSLRDKIARLKTKLMARRSDGTPIPELFQQHNRVDVIVLTSREYDSIKGHPDVAVQSMGIRFHGTPVELVPDRSELSRRVTDYLRKGKNVLSTLGDKPL